MATTLESNLYPPIVDTFMPAFLQTESCKVYFNLTDYNQPEDIKHAQITLVYQTTNKNALNITEHRNAIKIQKIAQDRPIIVSILCNIDYLSFILILLIAIAIISWLIAGNSNLSFPINSFILFNLY